MEKEMSYGPITDVTPDSLDLADMIGRNPPDYFAAITMTKLEAYHKVEKSWEKKRE